MKLQKEILQQFREIYPDLSITKISQMVELDPTRVFRLFRGHPMKLNEYEIFQKFVLQNKKKSLNNDLNEALELVTRLNQAQRKKILFDMNYLNSLNIINEGLVATHY
jgi:hypothetical protein